jgi:hypothetical protein
MRGSYYEGHGVVSCDSCERTQMAAETGTEATPRA